MMIRVSRNLALVSTLLVSTLLASGPAATQPPASGESADFPVLVVQATEYAAASARALKSLVCEERYEQRVVRRPGTAPNLAGGPPRLEDAVRQERVLVSDYLLVQLSATKGWVPFRDVYSVDGAPVRDRSDRLVTLFIAPHEHPLEQAERIRQESSRYNIGSVVRDINVPTLALAFLLGDTAQRFRFWPAGRERVGEVDAVMVDYEEVTRPTLIVGERSEDVPVRGRFWIEPTRGALVRTMLEARPRNLRSTVTVTYRYDPAFSAWLPATMEETHVSSAETVGGRATYSNFRRFKVETIEQVR